MKNAQLHLLFHGDEAGQISSWHPFCLSCCVFSSEMRKVGQYKSLSVKRDVRMRYVQQLPKVCVV